MLVRLGASLAIGFAWLVGATSAAAAPLHLSFIAPDECPSASSVLEHSLVHDVPADAPLLDAAAEVTRTTNGYRVVLRTTRGDVRGERVIEASTCEGAAEATAVVLALTLVPPPEPPRSAPREESRVETESAAPARDVVRAVPAKRSPLVAIGTGVAGDASSLPSPAIGASLTLGVTPGIFRIEGDGRLWSSDSQAASGSAAGARFSMKSIGLRGCASLLRAGAFDAAPCIGGDVHIVDAPGFGAKQNYEASAAWTTLDGSMLARATLTRWFAIRGRVGAFVPLTRPTFVVQNEGNVHRPPTLGAEASLGIEVLAL